VPTPDYILDLRRSYGQGLLFLPGVSAVVLRHDEHVLLTQRADSGHWSLPAGIVEPGEQPGTAMLRELLEETRVIAEIERLALLTTDPVQVYPNGDACQFVSMCFRCRYVSGEAQVGDEESTDVRWFPISGLPGDLSPTQRRRIDCALADRDDCILDR
jgi:ADP-ribose pyrophosphatase YjhB (NUDIX family)